VAWPGLPPGQVIQHLFQAGRFTTEGPKCSAGLGNAIVCAPLSLHGHCTLCAADSFVQCVANGAGTWMIQRLAAAPLVQQARQMCGYTPTGPRPLQHQHQMLLSSSQAHPLAAKWDGSDTDHLLTSGNRPTSSSSSSSSGRQQRP
jgi:hypothetical protein